MVSGILKLYVKRSDEHYWGLLEAFPYDDAMRRKMRYHPRLDEAKRRRDGWRHNYWQYANASFAIEDQDDEYSPATHIEGQRRDRIWTKTGWIKRGGLKRKDRKPKIGVVIPTLEAKAKVVDKNVVVEVKRSWKRTMTKGKKAKKTLKGDVLKSIRRNYRKQARRKAK